MKPDEDLPLETLLAVRSEIAPELDIDLLRSCYNVERRFQFSEDRTIALAELERLITSSLDDNAGSV